MAFWNRTHENEEAAPAVEAEPPRKENRMAILRREDGPNVAEINAVLGRGSAFEGKLTFEGTVRIEGKFTGEIHTGDTLVIGEGAEVQAEIFAGSVIVSGGQVTGNVHARTLIELEKGARVRGNLEAPSLKIEKGVVFVGSCKMENIAVVGDAPKNKAVPASSEKRA
jgi:cytoskeletal protein CcmA (bactofilin family)